MTPTTTTTMEPDGETSSRLLLIGEVARITGFSPKTLRYYEEVGLIQPASRTEAGYRLYGEPEVARLEFIKRARLVGLTLKEIKELIDLRADEELYKRRLEEILEARVVEIERRIVGLSEFRANFGKHPFPYVHE